MLPKMNFSPANKNENPPKDALEKAEHFWGDQTDLGDQTDMGALTDRIDQTDLGDWIEYESVVGELSNIRSSSFDQSVSQPVTTTVQEILAHLKKNIPLLTLKHQGA